MAVGSHFIWIPFLLSCVFQASDNRYVRPFVSSGRTGNSEVGDYTSEIPITQSVGIDPNNLNVMLNIKTCTDNETSALRRETRLLKLQLSTCSSTASAITGSYQTQVQNKMKRLLETYDSDTFLILKIITLTREVNTLQKKIKHAANSTENTFEITALQRELQEKTNELNVKTQQIERSHTNASLILQIISLQNQIWDLEQAKSRSGETSLQLDKRILALQEQMDLLISQQRGKGYADIDMLELISVHSKIAVMQRLIRVHIEQSRVNAADYQRQWRQKIELLKRKILQLNRDENNIELTKDILKLQAEIENFRQLLTNSKTTTDFQLKELRFILEEEKKKQDKLQKQLEEEEYGQAQLIMKIINIMNELRELDVEEQGQTTSTSQATTLQTLLRAKEMEYAKAQDKINELQRELRLKNEKCSGLEEKYEQVKTEYEQTIVDLKRTGNAKAALILNVINLHDELKTLSALISTTKDPERISELQRQLEEKQEELNSKTADIERLIDNPKIILTIIELQNEIWDLEKKAANSDRVKELQNRVDGLIGEIDDGGDENTKLMLKIMTLQSQVGQLQRQLSDLQKLETSQATQLANDLTTTKKELQKYVNELNEKNQTNARLILTVTDLHNQLRNLDKEKNNVVQTASATITKLREQLKAKVEELSRNQAEIKALQNQLNQTEAQCSNYEQKLQDLQNDLDAKLTDLQSKSDTVTSLALQVSTLTLQVEELKRQLQNTQSETKIKELQKIIDEKTNELAKKTEALKARSAQPQRILQIIAIQTEIEKLAIVATNDTHYNKIRALQDHLNYLIEGIQDENSENTQLIFKILARQDEIAKLRKQKEDQIQAELEKIKDLENELEDVRNQIKQKTLLLHSSDTRIANLSAEIMELHKKIKPLEVNISDLKGENAQNLEEFKKRLDLTKRQLQDSELLLKETDANNFKLIMEIADLRAQLTKTQKKASKAIQKNINELEQEIQALQRENRKLENANKDLKQEVNILNIRCSDANTQCDDIQRQLQQSQEDLNHLQKEYNNLERQLQQSQDNVHYLQQQLQEKDSRLNQLQQELEEQTREYNKLQDNYKNLQNKLIDEEDKTIIAWKMAFDPNTANPRIVLSEDNTVMSTTAEIQNVPELPGRFDVVLAVLGSTGFSSGRKYWEVSVAGKLCYHLGMASESIQRKGSMTFRPTNGFWTIVLNKQGQYRAVDKIPAIIPVQTQPLTLGILLDYKKGQISFYDAGARSHLYSFVGQSFTDKIFPFINFCVEDVDSQIPIVLLSPGPTDWIK